MLTATRCWRAHEPLSARRSTSSCRTSRDCSGASTPELRRPVSPPPWARRCPAAGPRAPARPTISPRRLATFARRQRPRLRGTVRPRVRCTLSQPRAVIPVLNRTRSPQRRAPRSAPRPCCRPRHLRGPGPPRRREPTGTVQPRPPSRPRAFASRPRAFASRHRRAPRARSRRGAAAETHPRAARPRPPPRRPPPCRCAFPRASHSHRRPPRPRRLQLRLCALSSGGAASCLQQSAPTSPPPPVLPARPPRAAAGRRGPRLRRR